MAEQSSDKDWISSSTEMRARIEHSLHARNAPPGTGRAKLEHVVKSGGHKVWHQLRKRPSFGVLLVGGTGLALAMLIGVGELTIAVIAGYGAYQVLREGVPPKTEAREIVEKIEKLG